MINAFQNIDENITIVRGDTLAFAIDLTEVSEEIDTLQAPLDQDLDSCYFSVRKDYSNTENVFQKSLGDGIEKIETGKYRVRIAPEDTADLDVGNYYYDCEIGINGDYFTILRGLFEVVYDITQESFSKYNAFAKVVDGTITSVSAAELGDITAIRNDAFIYCDKLTSFEIPNTVTKIGTSAFGYCGKLASINIPNSVTQIGSNCFISDYNLENVTLPVGITSIGGYTFSGCTKLASLIVPENVSDIANYAFQRCTKLGSLTVLNPTPPTIYMNTFSQAKADMNIYVPADSVNAYKAASYWSDRAAYIQAIA